MSKINGTTITLACSVTFIFSSVSINGLIRVLEHFKAKLQHQLIQQSMSNLPVLAQDAKPPANFTRRTANFHPTIWGDYFLTFVPNSEEGDSHTKQVQLLKEDVRKMFVSFMDNDFVFKLNFIDSIQRLGVSYHFEHEIERTLHQIYEISTKDNNIIAHDDDLHCVALLFPLLRQHGYHITSDTRDIT
ncbi:(-)-germacrene D synthase, partial [Mucuna pruriens]